MLDNKKLMKELASIYASSNKAKNSIVSELAKIDEKYKKLAEQEKAKLNEMLKNIEVQLGYYGTLLDLNNDGTGEVADAILAAESKEESKEEEPTIQDTIFPENNEPEEPEKQEEAKEAEVNTDAVVTEDAPQPEQKKKGLTQEDIVEKLEAAGFKNIEALNGTEDVKIASENAPSEQAVEDIPELNSPDWDEPNGEQKLDENGWPVW